MNNLCLCLHRFRRLLITVAFVLLSLVLLAIPNGMGRADTSISGLNLSVFTSRLTIPRDELPTESNMAQVEVLPVVQSDPTPSSNNAGETYRSIPASQTIGDVSTAPIQSYLATRELSDIVWTTYTDPVHGYTVEHPVGWIIEPASTTGVGGVTTIVDPVSNMAFYIGLSIYSRYESVSLADWVAPDSDLALYLIAQAELTLGSHIVQEQVYFVQDTLSQIIYVPFSSRVMFLNAVGANGQSQQLLRHMAASLEYDYQTDTFDISPTIASHLYPRRAEVKSNESPESISSPSFILPFSGKARITQTGDNGLSHNCPGWDCEALDFETEGVNNMDGRIYAAEAGSVLYMNWDPNGYGWLVKVQHSNGMVSWYAHLSSIEPPYSRETVLRGEWIGKEGKTGCGSCETHLHFAVKQGSNYTSTPVNVSNGLLPGVEITSCIGFNCGWAYGGPSLYTGDNLTGWSQVFGRNDTSLSDEFVRNDETRSIRVPSDWILRTYSGEHFSGVDIEYDGPFTGQALAGVASLKAAFRSCPALAGMTSSGNTLSGICGGDDQDTTPPFASGFSASVTDGRRADITTSGVQDNNGGSGVREVRFSAKWGGNWYGIGTDGSTPYTLSWDMCSSNVPNGDVELGMEVWDNAGNKWVWNQGNPHITKDSACGGSGDPLEGGVWDSNFWMNKYLAGLVNWSPSWLWEDGRWPYIYFDWGINGPKEGWSGDEFSLRIWRDVYFPGGHYEFRTDSDDGVKVYVDNQVVVDHWWDAGTGAGGRSISNGWHEVKVEYFENTGNAKLYVVWYGPGYPQPDNAYPDGRITSPADQSATSAESLTIWADAWDDASGVDYVRFMAWYCQSGNCDWHEIGTDNSAPYSYSWNWDAIGEQSVSLAIHVADKSGKVTYDPGGWVDVYLDKSKPAAMINLPSEPYLTNNNVFISVAAEDSGSGMDSVQFFAGYNDGSSDYWHALGTDTNGDDGWNSTWNASAANDQSGVSFFIYAYDKAGNVRESGNWSYILDRTPPTSAVTSLPSSSPPSFTVNWSGSDNAAGLASYDVQYQQDGGSWQNWLTQTTETSSNFTGNNGHTYGFRSRARDLAGHVEAWPASADATTTIDRAIPPAPLNFRATDGELIAEVRLAWDPSPGATTYGILYSEPGSSEVHLLGSSADTWFSDGQHVDGTIWAYAVKACSEAGCSDFSNFDTGYADMPILNPIDNPEGDGSFTVTWVAANTANSYRLEEQKDYGNWTNIYWGNLTSQTVSGKEEGTWCYRVSAHSGIQGDSPWTEPQCTYVGTEVDTVPPVVAWGWPVGNGMTFNATNEEVFLEVEATDNRSVTVVQFSWLDETTNIWQTFAEDTATPYQHLLDISILPVGCTKVDAMAFDAAGNTSSEYIWICDGTEPSWKTFVPTILR